MLNTMETDKEQEAQQLMPQPPEQDGSCQELISTYKEFFSKLKAAFEEDDLAESFQYIEHARSIAEELLAGKITFK